MTHQRYLKMLVEQLATVLFNTSQNDSDYNSKDAILNSIKGMIQDYNNVCVYEDKVKITDFRTK